MKEHEMPAQGAFCWNELATKDVESAKKFYTELLGWELKAGETAGMIYNEIVANGEHVGGMYQMMAEQGDMPSHWVAYVAVDDVDGKAEQVKALGGTVCVPPTDIPRVGRFCVINDPSGATLSLIQLQSPSS